MRINFGVRLAFHLKNPVAQLDAEYAHQFFHFNAFLKRNVRNFVKIRPVVFLQVIQQPVFTKQETMLLNLVSVHVFCLLIQRIRVRVHGFPGVDFAGEFSAVFGQRHRAGRLVH